MDVIVEFAEGFIGLFKAGAETLVGNITGILPLLAVIITVLNALMALIGEEFLNMQERVCSYVILYCLLYLPLQWAHPPTLLWENYWMRNINRHIVIL